MPDIKDLIVKQTEHDHWFDLAMEALEWKMKYVKGEGDKKEFHLYEKTELGFCFKGNCIGATPSDAFIKQAKDKDALFTINIKSVF